MLEAIKEAIKSATVVFSNSVRVVNTTPHPISFLDNGELVICPSNKELLVNARPAEEQIAPMLVRTVFHPTDEGQAIIDSIRSVYPDAIIIGSIIATNAYKDIVGMTPCKGYERVAPAEKRMCTDKFNVGDCF